MQQLETYTNQEGKKVRKFTDGRFVVTATYNNRPSDQAIRDFNKTYNDYFYEFNQRKKEIFETA